MIQSCDRRGPAAEQSFMLGFAQAATRRAGRRALGGMRRAGGALLAALVTLLAAVPASADTINVPPFGSIQDAIDLAVDGDEVVVACGIYLQSINFNGKAITVRAAGGGNCGSSDATVLLGNGTGYTVRCVSGEGPDSVLSGFSIPYSNGDGGMAIINSSPTITNCSFGLHETFMPTSRWVYLGVYNEGGSPMITDCSFAGSTFNDVSGTGMRNVNGSPTLINCSISGAGYFYGPSGGIYSTGGHLTVIDCVFQGNRSSRGGGLYQGSGGDAMVTGCVFSGNTGQFGGGMGVTNGTVTECSFSGNSGYFGGGMYVYGNPTVTRCLFSGNADFSDHAGGMEIQGNPTVTDCIFSGNTSASNTGGMLVYGDATVSNCTFVGNAGPAAGGLRNGTGSTTVTNCVFRANGTSGEIVGSASVTYSNVQGGYAGEGNINADPLFGSGYSLSAGSPCIDAGNNLAVGATTDFNGGSRFVDDPATSDTGVPGNGHPTYVVDMGAIEYGGLIRVPSDQPTIQAAINAALSGTQIPVAPGTYVEAINLNGKAITLRSDSGDPADTIINGNGATHVVQCVSGEGTGTVLSGFTITGGNAPGGYGAGMLNIGSSPTVTDCVFSGNTAGFGGGMYSDGGSPTVTNCDFDANSAVDGGGGSGGGMYNIGGSPTVTGCTFSGNSTNYWGGGMANNSASPTVTGCSFNGNSAGLWGGGMYSVGGTPTVTSCAFDGNSATLGGGMGNYVATPVVTNCLFTENTATEHGAGMGNLAANPAVASCTFSENSAALGGGGMSNSSGSSPAVTNCVFWGDGPNEIFNDGSTPFVTYSNVQGGYVGTGNIDADPMFVDAASGDFRLSPASPCIDAGDNTAVPADVADLDGDSNTSEATPLDLDGNPRFIADPATPDTGMPGNGYPDAVVDMGAFEAPPGSATCLADLDGNGLLDLADINIFVTGFLGGDAVSDLDGNGLLDLTDITMFIDAFTAGCP
ncbi:MAG: hypothetical protein H6810_06610 [Phycisphaeraceae bacterium]|nr:MAG: hypothetical protein H6810_06610 [Phycisphaeraceae bacterium]